jgi:hypothetical protein
MGIEPTLSAWEAEVLPLNYTRKQEYYTIKKSVRQEKVKNLPAGDGENTNLTSDSKWQPRQTPLLFSFTFFSVFGAGNIATRKQMTNANLKGMFQLLDAVQRKILNDGK